MHCAAFGIPAGVIMPQLLNPLLFALTVAVRLLLGSVVFVNLEAHAPPSFAGNSQRGDVGSACFMSKARMWLRCFWPSEIAAKSSLCSASAASNFSMMRPIRM
jgi:hypothetical protein